MQRRQSYYLAPQETKTFEIPDDLVATNPRRILLLEDDDELADVVAELLRAERYLVDRVSNGAEGLRRILANDYDAIVCDMIMPNFPGDMFYLAVQRSKPHLCKRFVFTTGHRANPKVDSFLKDLRALVLWKPFQPHELLDAIKVIIRKSSSPGAA